MLPSLLSSVPTVHLVDEGAARGKKVRGAPKHGGRSSEKEYGAESATDLQNNSC